MTDENKTPDSLGCDTNTLANYDSAAWDVDYSNAQARGFKGSEKEWEQIVKDRLAEGKDAVGYLESTSSDTPVLEVSLLNAAEGRDKITTGNYMASSLEIKIHETGVDALKECGVIKPSAAVHTTWEEGREAMFSTMARNVYTKLFGDDVVFLVPKGVPYEDHYKWGWIPLTEVDVTFDQAEEAGFTKDFEHWLSCTNLIDSQQKLATRDIPEYCQAVERWNPSTDLGKELLEAFLQSPDSFVKQPPVWNGLSEEQQQVAYKLHLQLPEVYDKDGNIDLIALASKSRRKSQGPAAMQEQAPVNFEDSIMDQLIAGNMLNMTVMRPFEGEVTAEHQLAVDRLLVFFNRANPELANQEPFGTHVDPTILTYQGIIDGDEVKWIRFQLGEHSRTYAILDREFNTFLQTVRQDPDLRWAKGANHREAWHKRELRLNVSKAPIELPLAYFMTPWSGHEMDDLYDGDFKALDGHVERLKAKLSENLRDITAKAMGLTNAVGKRDHDLYLVFKSTDTAMQTLNASLEKVYPLLPESGEVSVGDNPINLFEWNIDKKSVVTAKQIIVLVKHCNNEIEKTRGLLSQHPVIQKAFAQEVKTILFAASHFTKKLYGCKPEDVDTLVQAVANSVVSVLTRAQKRMDAEQVKLGLDLNSWIVWEYRETGKPVRSADSALNFIEKVLNRYTDSFVEALYAFLLNSGNPLFRPYSYTVKADKNDGIELGSIRRT